MKRSAGGRKGEKKEGGAGEECGEKKRRGKKKSGAGEHRKWRVREHTQKNGVFLKFLWK